MRDVDKRSKVQQNPANQFYNGSNTNSKVRDSNKDREDGTGEKVTVSNDSIRQTSESMSGTAKIDNLVSHFAENSAVRRDVSELEPQGVDDIWIPWC
ncbi:unnamed protein product [[Candida] boidinii]|nr:unnamed protein product [[Candida] boidinii]